jgi:cell division protein FtsL
MDIRKPVPTWLFIFVLVMAASFAVLLFVQRVQLYILQRDIQRLEEMMDEDDCWSETDDYIPTSQIDISRSILRTATF